MLRRKIILIFLFVFAVVYGILLVPQTNAGKVYAEFFRWQGKVFFGNFGKSGGVNFEINEEEKNKWEYRNKMFIFNRKQLEESTQTGSQYTQVKVYLSWYNDYLFVALLIALIIASPISIMRKLLALPLGFLILQGYIVFSLWVNLLFKFNRYPVLDVVQLGSFMGKATEFLYPILVLTPGVGIFIATLTWLMVCFRKDDYQKLLSEINRDQP